MKNKLLALFCLGLLLASCSDNSIYRHNIKISEQGWNKDSVAQFVVPVVDTVEQFDIFITVRNTNDYPRENLYLFVKTLSPQGNFAVDTLNFFLADIYGNWTGKSISRIWDNKFPYRTKVKFAHKGNYTFEIEQAMRYNNLNGISDVGIEISATKK
jgi:gliding motility-associated lipoprotein GldH